MELVDSEGSCHTPPSHMPKRLHKSKLAKSTSGSGSSLESDSESGCDSKVDSVV